MPAYIQAQEPNYFGQFLSILSTQELAEYKSRCEQMYLRRLAEILNDEIEERVAIEKALK